MPTWKTRAGEFQVSAHTPFGEDLVEIPQGQDEVMLLGEPGVAFVLKVQTPWSCKTRRLLITTQMAGQDAGYTARVQRGLSAILPGMQLRDHYSSFLVPFTFEQSAACNNSKHDDVVDLDHLGVEVTDIHKSSKSHLRNLSSGSDTDTDSEIDAEDAAQPHTYRHPSTSGVTKCAPWPISTCSSSSSTSSMASSDCVVVRICEEAVVLCEGKCCFYCEAPAPLDGDASSGSHYTLGNEVASCRLRMVSVDAMPDNALLSVMTSKYERDASRTPHDSNNNSKRSFWSKCKNRLRPTRVSVVV